MTARTTSGRALRRIAWLGLSGALLLAASLSACGGEPRACDHARASSHRRTRRAAHSDQDRRRVAGRPDGARCCCAPSFRRSQRPNRRLY